MEQSEAALNRYRRDSKVISLTDKENIEVDRLSDLNRRVSEAEAERVYALLTDGGEIFMKMERTPFANRFAMLRDRFGTSWMLLHQPAAAR